MGQKSNNASIQEDVRAVLKKQNRILLGSRASSEIDKDPKHFFFVSARYKFVAKMFENKGDILEVGGGDGFGTILLAQAGNNITCIDLEPLGLEEMMDTHWVKNHITPKQHDMVSGPVTRKDKELFDAAFSLDVIEHIHPDQEDLFIENMVNSIHNDAPMIIGTPNEAAKAYASKEALSQHINWKNHKSLRKTCEKYYKNVFIFGMNDEVLHTGFPDMCHYLFALCTNKK